MVLNLQKESLVAKRMKPSNNVIVNLTDCKFKIPVNIENWLKQFAIFTTKANRYSFYDFYQTETFVTDVK